MPRFPSLPVVDIFANQAGGVTILTTDPETGTESAVHLPLEFVPGVVVLLQSAVDQIRRDRENPPCADGKDAAAGDGVTKP